MQDELGDRVDGNARGDLSRRVPTHAVGDEVETGFVLNEKRVLVVLPLPPNMGKPE